MRRRRWTGGRSWMGCWSSCVGGHAGGVVVDRLGRSLRHLNQVVTGLYARGVRVPVALGQDRASSRSTEFDMFRSCRSCRGRWVAPAMWRRTRTVPPTARRPWHRRVPSTGSMPCLSSARHERVSRRPRSGPRQSGRSRPIARRSPSTPTARTGSGPRTNASGVRMRRRRTASSPSRRCRRSTPLST